MASWWGSPGPCVKPSLAYLKKTTSGDMNSFFMLFFDNFSSLLGILAGMISCPAIATSFSNPAANFTDADGKPMASDDGNYYTRGEYDDAFFKMVFTQVCPGIGCALLFGNIWYAMMAAKLSTTTGREDHTALPCGINTPAGFLTVYMVMLPLCFGCTPACTHARPAAPNSRPRAAFARRARRRAAALFAPGAPRPHRTQELAGQPVHEG